MQAGDGSSVPAEPPSHLIYRHQARLGTSLRDLWASRDIIYTLAERDIRAQYKQATLGLLWALIAPLAMLGIFTIIFSRTKSLGIPRDPVPDLRLHRDPVLDLLLPGLGDRRHRRC